jgi:hypothetical protein
MTTTKAPARAVSGQEVDFADRRLEVDAHGLSVLVGVGAEPLLEQPRLGADERAHLARVQLHDGGSGLALAAEAGAQPALLLFGAALLDDRVFTQLQANLFLHLVHLVHLDHRCRGRQGSHVGIGGTRRGACLHGVLRRPSPAARARERVCIEARVAGSTHQHAVRIGRAQPRL